MDIFFFILILVALIVVHELGHFFAAKFFGIKVEEFGIGFPPRLAAYTFGETVYSLNILFFGGFVRIFGENKEEAGDSTRSFVNKPRLVQAAVIAAGIICNILFAWIVLSGAYMVGLPTSAQHQGVGEVQQVKTTIVGVLPNSPAARAGVGAGDTVLSLATASTQEFVPSSSDEMQEFIQAHQDESLVLQVENTQQEAKTFILKPEEGLSEGKKVVGVQLDDVGVLKLPFYLAPIQGALLAWHMTSSTAVGLLEFFGRIFTGRADFASVAGPIGITTIGAEAVESGFVAVATLTALISINLALINVLPIPGLDGGRLLIIAIEGVTRRKVSDRVLTAITVGGFSLLILLMLVVSYHDIIRLIS